MALNWVGRSIPLTGTIYAVRYGAGVFVAVVYGTGGGILTSLDGITWTTTFTGNFLAKCAWNGNVFLVTNAADNSVLLSPDGINWTSYATTGTFFPFSGFAASPSLWISKGGTSGFEQYRTSPDGINWTDRIDALVPNGNGIAFVDNRFIAAGNGSSTARGLATSIDGINWTTPTFRNTSNVIIGTPNLKLGYGRGDGRVIAINTALDVSYESTDNCANFQQQSLTGLAFDRIIDAVSHDGAQFIYVGSFGTIRTMSSANGAAFEQVNTALSNGGMWYDTISAGGIAVAAGGGAGAFNIITSGVYVAPPPIIPLFWQSFVGAREVL